MYDAISLTLKIKFFKFQSGQIKRHIKQKELAEKIVTMCEELDFAKDRYAKIEQDKLNKTSASKLKQKGHLLLKKDN